MDDTSKPIVGISYFSDVETILHYVLNFYPITKLHRGCSKEVQEDASSVWITTNSV